MVIFYSYVSLPEGITWHIPSTLFRWTLPFFHLLILPSIELKTMTFPPALPPWQAEAQLIMALHTFCLEPYAIWEVPLAAMKHEWMCIVGSTPRYIWSWWLVRPGVFCCDRWLQSGCWKNMEWMELMEWMNMGKEIRLNRKRPTDVNAISVG